ncbi:helix-turn-helix domain-containing protein [Streptomyces sp. NPDC050400]|uniref:helix-turn-helix domain-containing protein n=1 Tax=Streptomyces sp. NPDC050400 TaxID=3365610 RepID=UPI0037B74A5B
MPQVSHPSTSVQAAREGVAARLYELRRDAGLTGRALARALNWQASKVSRLQSGTTPPSDDDIRAWCLACDAGHEIPDLIAANRDADSMYVEWRRVQRAGLRRLQESRVPLFEQTTTFRVYTSSVIPGLLQTREYARALLGQISDFHGTVNDVDEAADARLRRSEIIRKSGKRFAFLIEEAVLRDVVGDVETMAGQLGYLMTAMAFPSVSVGIIPAGPPRRMWKLETFNIYDDTRVSVELLSAAVTVTAPGEIALYEAAFAKQGERAIVGAPARALISDAINSLG